MIEVTVPYEDEVSDETTTASSTYPTTDILFPPSEVTITKRVLPELFVYVVLADRELVTF